MTAHPAATFHHHLSRSRPLRYGGHRMVSRHRPKDLPRASQLKVKLAFHLVGDWSSGHKISLIGFSLPIQIRAVNPVLILRRFLAPTVYGAVMQHTPTSGLSIRRVRGRSQISCARRVNSNTTPTGFQSLSSEMTPFHRKPDYHMNPLFPQFLSSLL